MLKFDRQFILSAVIVILLLGAFVAQRYPSFSYLQILLSVLAVAVSIGAVRYQRPPTEAPKTASGEAGLSVQDERIHEQVALVEANLRSASRPVGKWGGKPWAQIYANDEPSLHYSNLYRDSPITQDGNHFHCDLDYPADYTLSVGMMDIEVSDGEAKITIRSRADRTGAAVQDMGRTPARPARFHS